MQLILLRHADAENAAATDAERRLTDKGRAQAECVGRFCQRHHILPKHLLTSPYRRSVETAAIVAKAMEIQWTIEPFLASGMDAEAGVKELQAYRHVESVMIVGHQPDLGMITSWLIGLPHPENLVVAKASLIVIEIRRLGEGGGRLALSIGPTMME